jgi:CelD/BcsL family acetyltransferase involved in cellulose biosynthesis
MTCAKESLQLSAERVPVLRALGEEWDRLARGGGSPFLSTAWLTAWTEEYAPRAECVVITGQSGRLLAGACLRPVRFGWASTSDDETGWWGTIGSDVDACAALWEVLSALPGRRMELDPMTVEAADTARTALERAGFLVHLKPMTRGPRLALPSGGEEMLSGRSPGLRSQFRRRLRALGREGPVVLRTSRPQDVERDLAVFLRMESAGWKGRLGTAILSSPSTARLYTRFARLAAREGWLRLQSLEVGDRVVAVDLNCAWGGGVHLLKTSYDESIGHLSPGLVLRGLALQDAIEEGAAFFDFLGLAEEYKVRWGGSPRAAVALRAYQGRGAVLPVSYHRVVRPRLASARSRWRELASQRSRMH